MAGPLGQGLHTLMPNEDDPIVIEATTRRSARATEPTRLQVSELSLLTQGLATPSIKGIKQGPEL
jgi:hypothetical protein